MCGRYTLRTPVETLAERFELDEYPSSISATYYIRMEDGSPFAVAGLWESWHDCTEIRSATIITTDANDVVAPIHNRMPVILQPEDYELWLDPDFDEKEPLTTLLKPYPAEAMEAYPVSRRANSPSNNEPSVIESVA